jgi:hypothetical protein
MAGKHVRDSKATSASRRTGRRPSRNRRSSFAPSRLSEAGNCRVPKSRDNLTEHVFVCAGHARAFNESWDFFKGMGDNDIARFREEAMFGHRPTWPMGKRAARARTGQGPMHFHDGHAVFDEDDAHTPPSGTPIDPPADHRHGHAATGP